MQRSHLVGTVYVVGTLPRPKTAYITGLDPGQSQDYSALTILEHAGPGDRHYLPEQHWNARHLQRWELQTPYPTIVRDVVAMLGQPPLAAGDLTLVIDMTGVGRPVVDLFRAVQHKPSAGWVGPDAPPPGPGLNVRLMPIQITGGNQMTRDGDVWNVPKRDLAGVVQVALQSRRLKIAADPPDAPVLKAELGNFRVRISLAGHDSYGAGTGEEWSVRAHDDLVLSVACALWAARRHDGSGVVKEQTMTTELRVPARLATYHERQQDTPDRRHIEQIARRHRPYAQMERFLAMPDDTREAMVAKNPGLRIATGHYRDAKAAHEQLQESKR